MGENANKKMKIIIFLFSPIKSPPEGVWKIDPKVKNGPWGQIWKNHKFDEISFSSIRSPPEGVRKFNPKVKNDKKSKIFSKLKKKLKFYENLLAFILHDWGTAWRGSEKSTQKIKN